MLTRLSGARLPPITIVPSVFTRTTSKIIEGTLRSIITITRNARCGRKTRKSSPSTKQGVLTVCHARNVMAGKKGTTILWFIVNPSPMTRRWRRNAQATQHQTELRKKHSHLMWKISEIAKLMISLSPRNSEPDLTKRRKLTLLWTSS